MVTKKNGVDKAGVSDLIIGIATIVFCFVVIIIGFEFLYGMESDNQVVLDMSHETYSVSLLGLMISLLLVALFGGIEIGRYVSRESIKKENHS